MITQLMNRRGDRTEIKPVIESKNHTDHDSALESAAQNLLNAIQSKSIPDIRDALRSAFECLDSEPHIEGVHTDAAD
jgi:hypothetical protein